MNRGTRGSNTARNIGKLAPTGAVSFMSGAGVPFVIGNAIGPALGGALAAGTSMAGYGARAAATRMGMNNAQPAELAARNGGRAMTPAMQDQIEDDGFGGDGYDGSGVSEAKRLLRLVHARQEARL